MLKSITRERFTIAHRLVAAFIIGWLSFSCASKFISTASTPEANEIRVEPLEVAVELNNSWTPELEQEFQQRAKQTIQYFAGKEYGNTRGENEKRSYPYAMFNFLAGNRKKAIAFLEPEDAQASDNAHTEGIDYYYSFTLKGQIRKYFYFGKYLDPAYKQRMFDGAKKWTAQDPLHRPHPIYGKGQEGEGWGPDVRGGWVDGR
ncbi:MAG TPA: hypothetical protein V6C95_05895, partial [Coleofasciculaceae cyanobacterium]